MKTCLALTSLAAFSLFWLSPAQYANAAVVGLTPSPTSANDTPGSVKSQAQVETATAVGTITSSGNAKVTLKSAAIDGGAPLVFLVPVTKDDTSSIWADKVRTALRADLQVAELFEIGGTGSSITLTRKAQLVGEDASYYAANDATLNLALENDTAVGITSAISSEDTTDGELVSTAQVETATASGTITSPGDARVIVTADGLIGSPKIFTVPVSAGIPAIPGLSISGTITNIGTSINGTTTTVINGITSTTGLIPGQTLTRTAGTGSFGENPVIAFIDNASQIRVTTTTPNTSGSITFVPTVPAVPADTAAVWADKVRAQLRDSSLSNLPSLYNVGGDGTASITLTRKKVTIVSGIDIFAANDPTLNINIDNFTCAGIIPQSLSVNTTAGSLENVGQVETATALGAVTTNGNVEVVVTSEALVGSPKKILVPVAAGDSTSTWATKVRTALNGDSAVSSLFTASGEGSKIILSRNADNVSPGLSIYPDNDPTLNLSLFTGSKGIGQRLTSTNTTSGELSSTAQVEVATAAGTISKDGTLEVVVTAAGLPGSPKSINIPVLAGDTASVWAGKVRTAFNADPDITNLFAVGGTGDRVTLTSKSVQTLDGVVIYPTNDPTLNIALVIDSDRDNLADFDEIYETLGYKTNPNDPDTDRDGFSDSIEIAEGTNPTISTSKPNIALALYNVPDITNDPVDISIDGTFQPFGNRPATDKSSEDGSVTVRDQNGVIIWADNFGRAIPIPDSSLAKTLYVSNTECAIWQNRFDGTFSSRGSTTQIVLYRRDENGAAIPSPVISIPGTVLETSSVSPSTYGWTFVVSDTFDSGSLESRQRYQSGTNALGFPVYAVRDVNAWHDRRLTLYRLTWDNKLQTLTSTSYNVPVSYNNTGGIDVLGNGSDGALFVTDTIGYETYDDVDDPFPGVFLSQNIGTWVITTQDKEKIYRAISSAGLGESPTAVAHVSNSRLLFETDQVTSMTTFKIRDFRVRANGTIAQDTVSDLPAGERLLPVAKFTRAGLPITFYTIENDKEIRLYPADASAPYTPASEEPVTLPQRYLTGSAYVRNPRDNSLLLQMENRELVWVAGDSSAPAMNAPVVLPNSSKAEPMFVSERQAVAWMNSNAPIEITSSGARLPVAEIYHFDRSLSATKLTALSDTVRMPIEGRFVAAPPSLTPDPEREGWFISTFTKSASRSATMRTYQLFTVLTIDNDKDGIADNDEMLGTFGYTTDFLNPDSDGDGLSDAEELLPYEFVNTSLGWEAARTAAIAKGGKLAVLDTVDKLNGFRAAISSAMTKAKTSGNLWIGGHDTLTEGQIRWLSRDGLIDPRGDLVALPSPPPAPPNPLSNWQVFQPNNIGEADAIEVSSADDFKWAMAPVSRSQAYVIQYHTSNPNIADTDGDGLSDSEERPLQGDPNIIDTDGDGLTDREENTAGTSLVLVDTDGDGLSDRDELYRYEFVRPSLARPSLSWEDARLAAIAQGGKLAVLDSADAQGHFKAAMIKAAASGNLWIGAHDTLVEGEIRWLARDGLIDPRGDLVAAPAYTNWQASQPNNIGEADVMEASSADDFKWAMAPGSKVQAYAIEYYPLNPNSKDTDNDGIEDNDEIYLGTDPLDADTDDDNLKDGEELSFGTNPKLNDSDGDGLSDREELYRYEFVSSSLGWEAARLAAIEKGGKLAVLDSEEAQRHFEAAMIEAAASGKLWIGGHDTLVEGQIRWLTRDGLIDPQGDLVAGYTNWQASQPNNVGEADAMEASTANDFKWAMAPASRAQAYAIEYHPLNPNEPDSDGDGIDDYDEVTAGTDANDPEDPFIKDNDGDGLTNFDEIFVHFTDPNKADTDGDGINDDVEIANGGDPIDAESDTDGDGLKDRVETNTRVFVSAANTGTDPYNRDTDRDGLEDKVETFTRIYLSPSNTGTDPNYPDTDVDGLTDGEEINGFGPELYTSNPFTPDSDGDLVSDYDEVNAVPPTDPKDGTSYPTGVAIFSQDLHSTPSMLNDAQPVSIEDAFSPFGHRPDSEKTGEDGSVGLRDRNGVIVWIDNEGVAITLEDSSLAKILYVSNSECVVYNNRYAADYNARGSSSEVVIYRREGGVIKSSPPIILPGTLNDTAPVTPNTYGFTLMTSSVEENGNDSKQRVADGVRIQDGVQIQLYRTDDVDVWDRMYHRLYRVTWNGDKQDIATTQMSVPNNMLNLGDNKIVGFGSDGAFAFTQTVANDFFDDVDDSDPKIFKTATQLVWVNWNPNQEGFQINRWVDWFNPTYGPAAPKLNVAYVSNERLLFSEQLWTTASPFASTDNYILKDYRRSSDNSVSLINTYPLAAGDKPLGITSTNRKGLTPFLYVLNKEETSLKLYRVVDSLELLGNAVSLPAKLNENLPYVRNPIDGSLLIRTQLPTSAVWITGTLDEENGDPLGLESAQVIPRSFQAMPHYVSGTEVVLWMNHDAPVAAEGVIAPASMSHFQIKGGRVVETTLTPPIEGRFVMSPTTLTPDPESEGWYVTTFEKSGARTALIRMYRLTKTSDVDRDGDGLADLEELFYGTNPGNPDTDGDGLSDGEEVLPYELINNNKAWEDARIEAISKGGRLVVLDTASKQEKFAKSPAGKSMSSSLWIGGHDSLIEGRYLWLNDKGELEDSTSLLVNKSGGFKNWAINGITNADKAYGMEAQGGPDFKWSMGGSSKLQGYVIEYPKSDPLKSDSDRDGLSDGAERSFSSNPSLADSDGDGLNDKSEYDSKPKSKPYLKDTDGDGLDDYEEVVTYKSNPTLVDTDGDGLTDSEEKTAGTSLVLVDSDSDGYSDYQELKATPPTDPNDSTKFPLGGSVPRGWITGVEAANPSTTISVPVGWTPFGQRIDYTKWGDDGSRVYADASGMLLWKTSNGSIRPVPNSDKAVPLIVSNSKIIVWHNAYNNQADTPGGNGDGISPIEVYLYRLDGLGNVDPVPMIISNADSQKILGYDIIATAPVTATSHAYHLVTAGAPKDSVNDGGLSYSIYRITFEGDVQAISTINNDEGGAEDREMARAYGHGSDGSLVFYTLDEARPPEDRFQDAYWVDSARRATTTGVWEELHASETNEEGNLGSRVLYTSGTRVVYETVAPQGFFEIWRLSRYGKLVTVDTWYDHGLSNGDSVEIRNVISYENPSVDPNGKFVVEVISPSKFQYYLPNDNPLNVRESYDEYAATYTRVGERSYPIVDARRNSYTGFGAMDNVDISPGGDYYRFIQISTQTMEGDVRYCYALNKLRDSVSVYRLNNLGFQLVYTAKLPTGLLLDETATVEKINPADGSAVITSDNIDNIIWVQQTSDVEPTRNAIVIPGSRLAKTMFVDGKEMVVWNNAYDGPLSSGLLGKAKILHYRHTNGLLEPVMDLSSRIQGTFVMSTPIFVPSKEEWEFSTVEKTTNNNQAVIHNYRFTDNEMSDSDNDGIPDSVELAVHNTNPLSADTDGDGISDKDELAYGTDPNKADTDGDGVSDYDEIYVLFTDPTVSSFGTSASVINYNNAKGVYQGMVLNDTNGLTYHLSLSVTAKRSFSGTIQGAFGSMAVKGSLNATGSATITLTNLGEIDISMRPTGSTYMITGQLESTAGYYQFALRRAKTSQVAERLTFRAGLPSDGMVSTDSEIERHIGAASATGSVAKNGKVAFQIYNPDGTLATYAGSVLESASNNGVISLFARNKQGSVLMGNMILVPNGLTKNKLQGDLKFLANDGINQDREVAGATFVPPTVGTLPLSSFRFGSNNMIMNYVDGTFDGVYKVATLMPTGVSVPLTENESAKTTYDRKTGLMKAVYTLTDATRQLSKATSTAYAVTVDGYDDMIGMYMDSASTGLFSVAPNSDNLPPVGSYGKTKYAAALSSAARDIPKAGQSYSISVAATGDWKVVIPPDVNWVSVIITNDITPETPPTNYSPLSGNGNATVTISVAPNSTGGVRQATITIGGAPHKIRQARY